MNSTLDYFRQILDFPFLIEYLIILMAVGILTGIAKDEEYWWLPSAFLLCFFVGAFLGVYTSISFGISYIITAITILVTGIIIAFNLNIPSEIITIAMVVFGFFNGHLVGNSVANFPLPLLFVIAIIGLSIGFILFGYIISKLILMRSNRSITIAGWAFAIAGGIALVI